jgi:antitoxin VapB
MPATSHLRPVDEEEFADILPLVMPLNIKDPRTDALVRELAALTGESITTAVAVAVRERLDRLRGPDTPATRLLAIQRIAARAAARPVLDPRTPDEILGYDEHGLPT